MSRAALHLFIVLVLSACGPGNGAAVEPPAPGQLAAQAPDSMRSCDDDSDCVAVEMACCDHCNSGFLWAVAREHRDEAEAEGIPCASDQACTELACDTPEVTCRDDRCTLQ